MSTRNPVQLRRVAVKLYQIGIRCLPATLAAGGALRSNYIRLELDVYPQPCAPSYCGANDYIRLELDVYPQLWTTVFHPIVNYIRLELDVYPQPYTQGPEKPCDYIRLELDVYPQLKVNTIVLIKIISDWN